MNNNNNNNNNNECSHYHRKILNFVLSNNIQVFN